MPIIDLLNEQGEVDRASTHKLHALMCHPDDKRLRKECFIAHLVNDRLSFEWDLSFEFPHDRLRTLLHAPSFEKITQRAAKSWSRGSMVGDILLFVLNCARQDPENATIRRAIHCIQQDRFGKKTVGGHGLNVGISTITRDWKRFRPVAHLWAAFQLLRKDLGQEPTTFLEDGLVDFLALAERLRLDGEAHRAPYPPGKAHKPVLVPDETWRPPRGLATPAEVVPPGLTEHARNLLASYRPRGKS